MDVSARKLTLIEWLIQLQDEKVISSIESLFKKSRQTLGNQEQMPMTADELQEKLDRSEQAIREGRVQSSSEILAHFKKRATSVTA